MPTTTTTIKKKKKKSHQHQEEKAIFNAVDYVMSYVGDSTSDWLMVKKQVVFSVNNNLKRLFSRRHYSTKKHTLNDLEKRIISYWRDRTGVTLILDPLKTHDPLWTNHGGRGWALNANKSNKAVNAFSPSSSSL